MNENFEAREIQVPWEIKIKKNREGSQATETSNWLHTFPNAASRVNWPFDILGLDTYTLEFLSNFFFFFGRDFHANVPRELNSV